MRSQIALAGLITLAVVAALAGGQRISAQEPIDPADFHAEITHPLFPLASLDLKVFEGEEEDPETGESVELRLESRVLPQTETVAGVTVTVLEEKDYEDGELVEIALDYFAQHLDGTVYYFGERVDNFEDGALKNHAGTWLAGEDGALPGIIMPAQPRIGEAYNQENAPGVAEDRGEIVATAESVTVPAGTYTGCVKTRDTNALEPGVIEHKWYCPGVGLVKEEGDTSVNELVSATMAPAPAATATASAPAPTPRAAAPSGVVAPNTGVGGAGAGAPGYLWALAAGGAAMIAAGAALIARRRARV